MELDLQNDLIVIVESDTYSIIIISDLDLIIIWFIILYELKSFRFILSDKFLKSFFIVFVDSLFTKLLKIICSCMLSF
jgi:hypothetical protein